MVLPQPRPSNAQIEDLVNAIDDKGEGVVMVEGFTAPM
ncbi:hypothetical protein A2U01_0109337, partial [Trifolium medium]|nr:hypothetical protein [Trifolium medium]